MDVETPWPADLFHWGKGFWIVSAPSQEHLLMATTHMMFTDEPLAVTDPATGDPLVRWFGPFTSPDEARSALGEQPERTDRRGWAPPG